MRDLRLNGSSLLSSGKVAFLSRLLALSASQSVPAPKTGNRNDSQRAGLPDVLSPRVSP